MTNNISTHNIKISFDVVGKANVVYRIIDAVVNLLKRKGIENVYVSDEMEFEYSSSNDSEER